MTTQIAVRLPEELVNRLDSLGSENGRTRSELVRRAIELYIYRLACERDADQYAKAPLNSAELALADDPDGWSTTAPW
jgi:metal-responsive CopG/Arc/MetJ family transcriptional regulator